MTLAEACDAYLRDIEARNLCLSTRRNYKSLFKSWLTYAHQRGLTELSSIDQAVMRTWRESWVCETSTQIRQLQQLRAFFTHAVRAGWIGTSPVSTLKAPRCRSKPTMPLSQEEFRALIAAAATKPKEQALLFLMRFSGLSIRDAATLRHDAISGNDLTLKRAKSGELVMLYVPDLVIAALDRIKRTEHEYFFWSGSSMADTATNYWRSRLNIVAREADVKNFRTHRLRDTFAVELLLANLPIQDVSTLLGHSSVTTTEKYYAPWNLARRNRLLDLVRNVYERNPSMLSFDGLVPDKNNTGAVGAAPVRQLRIKPVMRSSSQIA